MNGKNEKKKAAGQNQKKSSSIKVFACPDCGNEVESSSSENGYCENCAGKH